MASNDRLRRREAPEGSESQRKGPTPAPDVASILAVQRSAGNRALQRMLYLRDSGTLFAPARYANQFVPWEGTDFRQNRTLSDPTLAGLVKSNATFKGHFQKGMNVDKLETVKAGSDAELEAAATKMGDPQNQNTGTDEAKQVAVDLNRLLFFEANWDKYAKREDLAIRWVISGLNEFVPGENDLPTGDTPLSDYVGDGPESNTFFKLACVLIALVKLDVNLTKVRELTGAAPKGLEAAVQALHKHYRDTDDVQYDDTSTRFTMMNDWKYKAIFTGGTTWNDLPKHVELSPEKKYIFDIEGHTVVVRAKQKIAKDPNGRIATPKNVLEPDSDEGNYKRGKEFDKDIKYIWEKQ